MRNKLTFLGMLVGLATLGGCVHYSVIGATDHGDERRKEPGKLPITALETMKISNYFFSISAEHQFWVCQDTGDALVCDRRCGGKTDLTCPEATATGYGVSSNVR